MGSQGVCDCLSILSLGLYAVFRACGNSVLLVFDEYYSDYVAEQQHM